MFFVNPTEIQKPEIYGVALHLPSDFKITILQPSDCSRIERIKIRENIQVTKMPSKFLTVCQSKITVSPLNLWVNELSNAIKSGQCDIIHVCNYDYITAFPPIFVKKKFSVPIIVTNDALMGTGSYSFGAPLVDTVLGVYTHLVGKHVLKSYDKVVLLYSQLSKSAKSLGVAGEKLEIIPNGIDVQLLTSCEKKLDVEKIKEKYGIESEEKVVLYVGRLVKMKRVEIVIAIVKKLLSQGLKVKALIVGDGPQKEKLEKLSNDLNGNIIFTGFLGDEKYECFKIADLFVLPSLSEGLPTVLLEAAAFGVPMVAPNINGIGDVVIHGKTGFLVEKQRLFQYVNFAYLILTNDEFSRNMGLTARNHVRKYFSWSVVALRYESVYRSLLKS